MKIQRKIYEYFYHDITFNIKYFTNKRDSFFNDNIEYLKFIDCLIEFLSKANLLN
jgi:hypothetical protein